MIWFYTGKQFALAISDFNLFFVTKEYIFRIVIHEMDRVYRLIVTWTNWHEFTIETYIV